MVDEGVNITESATVERFDTRPETMQQRVDFDTTDEVQPAIEKVSVQDLPGYQMGYEKGYWEGYRRGYGEGTLAGYDKGEERGWNRGFDTARRYPQAAPPATDEDGYVFEAHLDGLDCGRTPCATCGRPPT